MYTRTARHREQLAGSIRESVPDVETYEQLLKLQPAEFTRRHLEADDPRFQMIRRLRDSGQEIPKELLEPARLMYATVKCTLSEDATLADVEYQQLAREGPGHIDAGVQRVRKSAGGRWGLVTCDHMLDPTGGGTYVIPHEWQDFFRK